MSLAFAAPTEAAVSVISRGTLICMSCCLFGMMWLAVFSQPFPFLKEEVEDCDYDECHTDDTEIVEIVSLLKLGIADVAHHAEINQQE